MYKVFNGIFYSFYSMERYSYKLLNVFLPHFGVGLAKKFILLGILLVMGRLDGMKCPCGRALIPHAVGHRVPVRMGHFVAAYAIFSCFMPP